MPDRQLEISDVLNHPVELFSVDCRTWKRVAVLADDVAKNRWKHGVEGDSTTSVIS